jgi:predicted ArsR family transcriptional regulator
VPRSVAAFHLDKLADAGVVEVRFERTTGRSGPGAGRPSKLYRPVGEEVSASVPERSYDLAGSLLAAAVAESTRTGAPVDGCLATVARAAGRRLGAEEDAADRRGRRDAVVGLLARNGYVPELRRRGDIVLTNCPFHRLAGEERSLVCGMNLEFVAGLLEGTAPGDGFTARLEPEPGDCCVRISTT